MLAESGWGCPTWPVDLYGRGLGRHDAAVVTEEFERIGAVGPAGGSAMSLAAPTILAHGAPELQRRLLRGILTGEDKWCQLFSEPGNGSDLAGLTTTAVRDGDEWVVTGQKVWTTGAHHAAFGMLVARTDWDAPKHRGLTWFALSMDQPGRIEVRPLKQMNGYSSFNEVFLDGARVPHANVVGAVGDGWRAALTTLSHERGLAALRFGRVPAAVSGRCVQEAAEEAAEYAKTYEWYPQRAGRADLVAPRAREMGRNDDPVVRQAAAALYAVEQTARWNVARSRARTGEPGPEGSVAKLCASDIARRSAAAHTLVSGPHAMLGEGVIHEVLVSVPGASIAGGTDEIQHNIVAERVLGLPKEPAVDVDVPFREVRTNVGRLQRP
jgi:alkylation response protein AidB-like acyl-CoA dehydrogenase